MRFTLTGGKRPGEKFPMPPNDFTDRLGVGDSIVSRTITAHEDGGADVTASFIDTSFLTSPYVIVVIKGGTHGKRYLVNVKVHTSLGYDLEDDVMVEVSNGA